jgi:hypothetical protein
MGEVRPGGGDMVYDGVAIREDGTQGWGAEMSEGQQTT